MKQAILPIIPLGATQINAVVSVHKEKGTCVYFMGMHPVYSHPADDRTLFLLTAAQLIVSGACRQRDILETFGVSKSSIARALRRYREEGIDGILGSRRERRACVRRGGVMSEDVLEEAQKRLDSGMSNAAIAAELGVRLDTFRRAVWDGRLKKKETTAPLKALRSRRDQ